MFFKKYTKYLYTIARKEEKYQTCYLEVPFPETLIIFLQTFVLVSHSNIVDISIHCFSQKMTDEYQPELVRLKMSS